MVFAIVYCVLAYWAAGKTIYANYVMFGSLNSIFLRKFTTGFILGFILIPVAIVKCLLERR